LEKLSNFEQSHQGRETHGCSVETNGALASSDAFIDLMRQYYPFRDVLSSEVSGVATKLPRSSDGGNRHRGWR